MWRSKKFIIITVTVAAVVACCLVGVVFADTENGDANQPEALLDRVCEIYEENTGVTIDPQQLKDAFVYILSGLNKPLESVVKITKQIVVTSLLSLSVTIELLTLQERMIYDSN